MKTFLICILSLAALQLCAQGPVNWKFTAKKISDKTYEVHLKATVDEPWHIYSQQSPPGGPLPTKIIFSKNPLLMIPSKVKEQGDMEMYHDETFDVDVYAYGGEVDFMQTVKLKSNVKTVVKGSVEFMACTREQCLTPQTLKFSLKLE